MTAPQPQLAPIHLAPFIDPTTIVSSLSRWSDFHWYLDNSTAGVYASAIGIVWNFELCDGSRFSDPQHAGLLDLMRRFLWSLLTDNRHDRNLKPGTLVQMGLAVAYLVNWMVAHRLTRLDQFDKVTVALYLHDLPRLTVLPSDERLVKSHNMIYYRITVLTYLYRQSDVFRDIGIDPVPQEPFPGQGTRKLANAILVQSNDPILPLPDEIALPALAAASRMLGAPADDIIRLQTQYLEARGWGTTKISVYRQMHAMLISFTFSVVEGESEPWHPPIQERRVGISLHSRDRTNSRAGQQLLRMTRDLVGAAAMVVQGGVGIRISELMSLTGTIDPTTGWPTCLSVSESVTGLNEIFYLKGKLFKTTSSFLNVEWVCGMRAKGSSELPLVVRAIMVLERLLDPWRKHGGYTELFTMPKSVLGFAIEKQSISPAYASFITAAQRAFLRDYTGIDWLALPEGPLFTAFRQHRERALRPHQWRKTWAQFLFAVDHTHLSAISQHFKHLSLAMTEQHYIGNDPTLLTAADEVQTRQTVSTLFEIVHGRRLVVGGLASLLQEHKSLQELVRGKSESEGYQAVERFVIEHDLRFFFQDPGKCGIGVLPMRALCHQVAGTSSSTAIRPNYSTRQPSLCVKCPCWFTDGTHSEYWSQRYLQNRTAQREYAADDPDGLFTSFRRMSEQAAGILRALKLPIPHGPAT